MVNQEYYNLGTAPSVIRQLFAYGLEQAAKVGADKVYDYSLGNPSIPAPKKVNESIKKIVDEMDSIKLHGYSMAAGFDTARAAVAKDLAERFGLDVKASELFFTCGAAPALISIIKALIVDALDAYNASAEANGEDDKVVRYTDVVGTLMTSVTRIINMISNMLVAFVSISLVVSSIMIGIITYISVLERRKEIGILRAIGASKRNISEVFNAETFIIGLCSGLMGIGLSRLLLIPGNMLIQKIAVGTSVVAVLPWKAAVVLVALATVLTILGGFIPAKTASRSDPVKALRAE